MWTLGWEEAQRQRQGEQSQGEEVKQLQKQVRRLEEICIVMEQMINALVQRMADHQVPTSKSAGTTVREAQTDSQNSANLQGQAQQQKTEKLQLKQKPPEKFEGNKGEQAYSEW